MPSGRARSGGRRRDDGVLRFEAGRVFPPGEAKADDLCLEPEVAAYRARQGQGGRRGRPRHPHPFGCRCPTCAANTLFGGGAPAPWAERAP